MAHSGDLQLNYAKAMRNHPFGFALYHPCNKALLKPGSCGYFNHLGDWNPISDVLSSNGGFVGLDEDLQAAEPQKLSWGPKCSEHVTERRLKTKMFCSRQVGTDNSTIPGIPADVNVFCKYTSSSNYGAVLLNTPPVTKEFYYHDMPFVRWLENNSRAIIRNYPEVKNMVSGSLPPLAPLLNAH